MSSIAVMSDVMRTTVRIDDDLLQEIKARAARDDVSMTRMLNRVIREGLEAVARHTGRPKRYVERPVSMGSPRLEVDKAMLLAAGLEDEETLRKLALRK